MSENIETSIDSSSMRDYTPEEENDVEVETTSEEVEQTSTDSSEDIPDEESDDEVSSEPQDAGLEEAPSSEETFAKSFDPKSLSPELQQAYKQMQADYTKKTQEIAGARKQLEAYNRNRALIEYLSSNPEVANQFIQQMQQPKVPQEQEIEIPDDPVEFYKRVKEEAKKESLSDFMKIMSQREEMESRNRWVNEQAEAAAKLDPRLDDEGFASIISDIVTNDPGIARGQKDIVQATKDAIARYDAHFNAKLEAEKKKLSDMARQKRNPSVPSTNAQTKAPNQEPKTMREAFQMSFGK